MLGYYRQDANARRYQHRQNNHLWRCKLFHFRLLLQEYHKDGLFQEYLFLRANTLKLLQLALNQPQISGGHMHDLLHHQLIRDKVYCSVISLVEHQILLKSRLLDHHYYIQQQRL